MAPMKKKSPKTTSLTDLSSSNIISNSLRLRQPKVKPSTKPATYVPRPLSPDFNNEEEFPPLPSQILEQKSPVATDDESNGWGPAQRDRQAPRILGVVSDARTLNLSEQQVSISRQDAKQERPESSEHPSEVPPEMPLPTVEELANHPRLLRQVPIKCVDYFVEANKKILHKYAEASERKEEDKQHEWIVKWLDLPTRTLASVKSGYRKTNLTILRRLTNYNKYFENEQQVSQEEKDAENEHNQNCLNRNNEPQAIPEDAVPTHIIRAKKLVRNNHIGRGVRALVQTKPPINIDEGNCKDKVLALHKKSDSPTSLTRDPLIRNAVAAAPPIIIGHEENGDLLKTISHSANGASPGPSGWTGEMLLCLARDPECLKYLSVLCTNIHNGFIPSQTKPYILSSKLVPFEKNEKGDLRPISIGEIIYRVVASRAIQQVAHQAAKVLLPHQFGVAIRGGIEIIIHDLQNTLEQQNLHLAALSIDFKNAFNAISRKACFHSLMSEPDLAPIWKLATFAYSEPSKLFSRHSNGTMVCEMNSEEGSRQGDPLGLLLFCLGLHPILKKAIALNDKVSSKCYVDDLTLVGPPEELIPVYQFIENESRKIGLEVQHSKCKLIYFHEDAHPLPRNVRTFVDDNVFELKLDGDIILGAPVAKDDDTAKKLLKQTLKSQTPLFESLKSPYMTIQETMLLLRLCGIPKLNFLLRVCRPSIMKDVAKTIHAQIIDIALQKLELTRSSALADFDWDKAKLQLQLPLKAGGMGLTNLEKLSDIAYYSSLAHAVEHTSSRKIQLHSVSRLSSTQLNDKSLKQIQASLAFIKGAIKDKKTLDLLPKDGVSFHSFYATHPGAPRRNLEEKDNPKSAKLQHVLTAALHQAAREQLLDTTVAQLDPKQIKFFKARQLAITAEKAHTWRATTPTHPDLRLRDHEYQLSTRMLLGLKPTDIQGNLCRACGTPLLQNDPYHFLSCNQRLSGQLTNRHQLIVKAINKLVDLSGGTYRNEPTHFARPDSEWDTRRTDTEILLGNKHILIDVSVAMPTCNTAINLRAEPKQLAFAKDKALNKVRKHRENAEFLHAQFIPFVMEGYGGIIPECKQLLSSLLYYSYDNTSPSSQSLLSSHLYSSISIALQKGNSLILQKCQSLVRARHMRSIIVPQH